MSFVRNSVLTQDRVHALIQNRSQLAKELSDAYSIAAEFLRVMVLSNTVEVSGCGLMEVWSVIGFPLDIFVDLFTKSFDPSAKVSTVSERMNEWVVMCVGCITDTMG